MSILPTIHSAVLDKLKLVSFDAQGKQITPLLSTRAQHILAHYQERLDRFPCWENVQHYTDCAIRDLCGANGFSTHEQRTTPKL